MLKLSEYTVFKKAICGSVKKKPLPNIMSCLYKVYFKSVRNRFQMRWFLFCVLLTALVIMAVGQEQEQRQQQQQQQQQLWRQQRPRQARAGPGGVRRLVRKRKMIPVAMRKFDSEDEEPRKKAIKVMRRKISKRPLEGMKKKGFKDRKTYI